MLDLERCLRSLANQVEPADAEVLVGLNGGWTPEWESSVLRRFPWAKVHRLEKTMPGEARNRVVAHALAPFLYFLDDDVAVPPDFLRTVLEKFERYPQAPAIGGPNLALPRSQAFQRATDFFLRSAAGAGPARARYIRGRGDTVGPDWSLTSCNLGVRREVFDRHGIRFPSKCVTAEENLFLHRVSRRLGPPVLSPDLYLYHDRRRTLSGFCRQLFGYGLGRMQITRLEPGSIRPFVVLAALWPLYLAGLPWLGRGLVWTPALAYALAVAAESLRLLFTEKDPKATLWLLPAMPLGHLSYAAGLLSGMFGHDDP